MSRRPESIGRKALGITALIVLLPILIPVAIIALTVHFLTKTAAYLLVWILWLPHGKDVLFVSSDSPIWKNLMDREIRPLVADRAECLNWSLRKTWPKRSLARFVFRTFAGRRDFNPIVILFRPFHAAQIFRFYRAFKDHNHGNFTPFDQLRSYLSRALKVAKPS